VIPQFQLEDLVEQGEWEVIYLALDTASGEHVALRRFFPFGMEGGGLKRHDLATYDKTIERLIQIRHTTLRKVIAGGWDPVDHMPYLVTEWAKGTSLQSTLETGPLKATDAVLLIRHALEASLLCSAMLRDELLWVETDLSSIRMIDDKDGRHFNFCFSPFKLMSSKSESQGPGAIIALAEAAMHWQGRMVASHAGHGLGDWLNWLRDTSPTPNLHEALKQLPQIHDPDPEPEDKASAAAVTTGALATPAPILKIPVKSSRAPMWIVSALAAVVVVLGAWLWIFSPTRTKTPDAPAEVAATREKTSANHPSLAPSQGGSMLARKPVTPSEPQANEDAEPQTGDGGGQTITLEPGAAVHSVADQDALMEKDGEEAALEGCDSNHPQSGF